MCGQLLSEGVGRTLDEKEEEQGERHGAKQKATQRKNLLADAKANEAQAQPKHTSRARVAMV